MHVTLNIGTSCANGRVLTSCDIHIAVCRLLGFVPYFTRTMRIPGQEDTAIVCVHMGSYRAAIWASIINLANNLDQDCIAAVIGGTGYLLGRKTKEYEPFDLRKFIGKEQAMSYGSPQDPSRSGTREFNVQHEMTMLKERITKLEAAGSQSRPSGWMAGAGSTPAEQVVRLELTTTELAFLCHKAGTWGSGGSSSSIYKKLHNCR